MKYYSEVTKKVYETVEELERAEEKIEELKKEEEEKKAIKKARLEEIEAAFKEVDKAKEKLNEKIKEYVKDYGSYRRTTKDEDGTNNFFSDWLFKF